MLTELCSKSDFDELKINEVLQKEGRKQLFFYQTFADLLKDPGINDSQKAALNLLNKICFYPQDNLVDKLLILDEMHLEFLKSIVEDIGDNQLKSRIANILFIKTNHHKYAEMAIKAFLRSGCDFLEISSEETPDVNCFRDKIDRALEINFLIKNSATSEVEETKEALKKVLAKTAFLPKNDYLIESLLDLICKARDYDFCLDFIDLNFAKITNIHDKDRILAIGILAAQKLQKTQKANDFYRHKAQNFFKEANRFASEGESSYIGAHYWLKEALFNLKKINSKSEDDRKLEQSWKRLLTEFNHKVISESMIEISVKQNADDLINYNKQRLEEIKKYQSNILETLVCFTKEALPKYEDLSKKTEITLADFVGKITFGNGEKEVSGYDSEKEKAIQSLGIYWGLSVHLIEEARKYIITTFKKDEIDWAISFFIQKSPLVSQTKLDQFFAALEFGFFGDWVVSSHLIPARIEGILRERLKINGIYKLKTEQDLTQKDHLFGDLLSGEFRENLDQDILLGKDVMFNIEALLQHKHGANLRNEIYHGLCEDNFFTTPQNIYLWWMFLKIIVDSHLKSKN